MALTKEQRITMSKKIVQIPEDNAGADSAKVEIQKIQTAAIKADSVNEALQDIYNQKINEYQIEYNYIDGNLRTEITEPIIESAAKLETGNGFFLSDTAGPIPSVPDGLWRGLVPMSFTYAIGKKINQTYDAIGPAEEGILPVISGLISQIESFIDPIRASGKKCIELGVCTGGLGGETSEIECTDNGGTWDVEDTIVVDTLMQTALADLKTQVQNWEDSLNFQKNAAPISDSAVPSRQAENQAAYNSAVSAIAIINTWQSFQDFDTTTSLPNNCPAFDSLTYDYRCTDLLYPDRASCELNSETWYSPVFQESKLSLKQVADLKIALSARTAFVPTRKAQLAGYFGGISQDLTTGRITGYTGWYGQRFLILDSRLNLISGTANAKFGSEKGIEVQEQIKESNEITLSAYETTMRSVKLIAAAAGNEYINVKDASDFNTGDRIYVVADNQEELSGSILEKNENRLKLSFVVPKKYTTGNSSRIYKILTNTI